MRLLGVVRKTGYDPPTPERARPFHSTGRKHPAMEVTIQMKTAMTRALNQPMVYSFCNERSHTIPATNAGMRPWPST